MNVCARAYVRVCARACLCALYACVSLCAPVAWQAPSRCVCVWQEIKVCTASVVLMMLLAYANEFGVNLGFGHVVFKLF